MSWSLEIRPGACWKAGPQPGGGASVAGGGPSYVLGLDEFGNIKHEVQPGQTIGHILLIYGYTWDDYPYLLELNGMIEADRLNMQPGSVILVPPKAGTFTPAPKATVEATTEATAAPTITATQPAATIPATPASPTAAALEIRIAPIETATPRPPGDVRASAADASSGALIILGLAILLQLAVIGGASIALWRSLR